MFFKNKVKFSMKAVNSLEPLGLRAQLELSEANTLSLQWVPYVNLLALAFGLLLLNSRWLCPPGIQLQLPKTSATSAYGTALPVDDILIIDADKRLFFHHRSYDFSQLEQLFLKKKNDTLLLQADEHLPLAYVLQIMTIAKGCGYRAIQVATEVRE